MMRLPQCRDAAQFFSRRHVDQTDRRAVGVHDERETRRRMPLAVPAAQTAKISMTSKANAPGSVSPGHDGEGIAVRRRVGHGHDRA